MNFMSSIVNFFKDGGLFLYPLALIFVVGVSIAIERYVYLTRETMRNRSLWENLVPALSAGNFKQVVSLTQNSKASIATILNYGVARVASARRRDDIEKAMDESLLEVIPRIEKRTHYLSSLANVGLLIGLLGTITGLIGAFSAVATANPAEKASLLAAAISVAMNNTASGLFVAITLLLSHMFLESKTTSLIDSLEIASVKFLNSITERQHEPAAAPQAPAAVPARPPPAAPSRDAQDMKSKSARLVRRNHARYHQGRDDLNIVPMIDMMVILVFFLIFTAVFSKTNILQLNLPASNSAPVDLPKGLKLEVIIRPDDLVVNDRNSGPLKVIANTASGYD